MIEIKISKAGKLADGTVNPLTLQLTSAAQIMAEALRDTAMNSKQILKFQVGKRSYLSDEYMRLLGGGRDSFKDFAEKDVGTKNPILILDGKSWSWRNSDTWHALLRKNDASYNRTGGMWAGLRVRNFGSKGAIIEFAGKSEGQTGEWKTTPGRKAETAPVLVTAKDARGNTVQYYRAPKPAKAGKTKWSGKVNNNLKAWTVYQQKKTLLLEPDTQTQQAFETGVSAAIAKWADAQMGSQMPSADSITLGGLSARFFHAFI